MADEKDRLGDKMRDVEAAREDQWAHQRDLELIEKMRKKQTSATAAMLCPKCKQTLVAKVEKGVAMLACPAEDGAWLDGAALKNVLKSRK
jgi:uncharacterized protein with PIN domain